jgi:DNA-binding CsgD family transcriptional regulator
MNRSDDLPTPQPGRDDELATAAWALLTARERDVVSRLGLGLGDEGIAKKLHISPLTVVEHLRHVRRKLNLTLPHISGHL